LLLLVSINMQEPVTSFAAPKNWIFIFWFSDSYLIYIV